MFPYVCLATMPLFCHVDWPRKISASLLSRFSCIQSNKLSDQCDNGVDGISSDIRPQAIEFCAEEDESHEKLPEELGSEPEGDEHRSNGKISPSNGIENGSTELMYDEDNCEAMEPKKDKYATEKEPSSKNDNDTTMNRHVDKRRRKSSNVTRKQKAVVTLLLFHVFMQFFLPYSHFITKVFRYL